MPFADVTSMLRRGIVSPETYEANIRARAAKFGRPVIEMTTPAQVRVELGRLLADCACGAGMAAHAEWPIVGCRHCFRIYKTVYVPVDLATVEQLLSDLPLKHQTWDVEESVAEVAHRVRLVTKQPIREEDVPIPGERPPVVDVGLGEPVDRGPRLEPEPIVRLGGRR